MARQVRRLTDRALTRAGLRREQLRHGVLALPTVVDAEGRMHRDLPTPLPGFDQAAVDAIRAGLGRETTVENDVNLAALGERSAGAARGREDFAYLYAGHGIGMGIVMHGEIHRGARGAAGEVSRLPFGPDSGRPPAEVRRAGRLHLAAGAAAFADRAERHGLGGCEADQVFAAAGRAEPAALAVVAEHAAALAGAVAAVHAVLDPELTVLGGPLGGRPELLAPLRDALAELSPVVPAVTVSALGAEAVLRGAESLAAERMREMLYRRVTGG